MKYTYFEVEFLREREKPEYPTPVLLPRKSHGWRSLVKLQSMG